MSTWWPKWPKLSRSLNSDWYESFLKHCQKRSTKVPNHSLRNLAQWHFIYLVISFFFSLFVLMLCIDSETLISTSAMKNDIFFFLSYAYQPIQKSLFVLLMISSLFGNSTFWHGEMTVFGWGRVSVMIDLSGSLFFSALNPACFLSFYLLIQNNYLQILGYVSF